MDGFAVNGMALRALCLNVPSLARTGNENSAESCGANDPKPTPNGGVNSRGRAVDQRTWTRSRPFMPGEIESIVVDGTDVKIYDGGKVARQILWELRIRKGRLDDSCL